MNTCQHRLVITFVFDSQPSHTCAENTSINLDTMLLQHLQRTERKKDIENSIDGPGRCRNGTGEGTLVSRKGAGSSGYPQGDYRPT